MSAAAKYDAKQIKLLQGLEPVRKRPGMYIGSTDTKGLHHLAKEILDNSVDEAIAGFGKKIQLIRTTPNEVHQKLSPKGALGNEAIIVVDNGRGIPTGKHESGLSAMEVVMTKLHAGGKFEETAYQASGGLHGVGSSAVNAVSSAMQVISKRDDKYHYQTYSQGIPKSKVKVISESEVKELFPTASKEFVNYQTGTIVCFVPDTTIFSTTDFNQNVLTQVTKDRAYLMAGLYFEFIDLIGNDHQHFYFENGIRSLVTHINMTRKPLHEVFHTDKFWKDEETGKQIGVEVALQYNDSFNVKVDSYVNVISTPDGGTHINGFRTALSKVLRDYAEKNEILKTGESFTIDDSMEGLTAVVFVKMSANDLQFESQTKAKLNNAEAQPAVYYVVKNAFTTFLEENPKIGRTIVNKILLASRARLAARAAKDAVVRKGVLEGSSLPGKLADCQSRKAEEAEIYIVEGDSAGGTAKQGRDRKFQAIFPLRGKILNTERARLDRVVAFEELKNLVIALGAGIGETFDISNLRYHRIILMNDADVDGEHITTLGLTFFFRHLPEVVKQGYLYVAVPPLYKLTYGKNEAYVYTEDAKEAKLKEINKTYKGVLKTQRYKGLGEMNAVQLWDTTMNPETRILKKITIADAEIADQTFSDLMGDDVAPRKKFIQKQAQFAKIDI
ncbi:MAG: DNA gyrase subunit B [Candidatus Pacebacteria bacterium]|nr:DNA gyrase subunit B [Candidatus Paceibacterota bacterium]MBT3511939.1 DNA gyrase subunit B [Candidatus Paceibacterota bacterium]MBT4005261.1 DNA gyrase subunit B [Candidatus Paceibacterota bacterium]MBT4358981.1 DNA gyrase subunit B [Candidatus Paceibacterota bacterium]MBT4680454.1 DNA gyrase subunit B [Candidatus Paceibacterota bacterium]